MQTRLTKQFRVAKVEAMNTLLSETEWQAVRHVIVEQLGVLEAQVTPQATIEGDLGADSLDKVEILLAMEDRFGVSVSDEAAERVSTVEDLCEALEALLHPQGHRS
jgi:acyl carrier protein